MLKKLIASAVSATLLISCMPAYIYGASGEAADAYMYLEEKIQSSNLSAKTDSFAVVEKDGLTGRRMTSETATRNLYVDINNSLLYQNDGKKSVEIEVEYFDEGTGRFGLMYDGVSSKNAEYDEYVFIADSRKWRTHTFRVNDGYFGNRHNSGSDFAIALYTDVMGGSPTDIVFRSVKVKVSDYEQTAKLKIDNGAIGGIFFKGEKPFVNLQISSRVVRRNNVDLIYTLYDEGGNVCWQDKKEGFKIAFTQKTVPIYSAMLRFTNIYCFGGFWADSAELLIQLLVIKTSQ